MTDIKGLTTIEVARLCRVSDATVKRWEDAGLLKSERTSGGHRRFRAEEVIRFQREQKLGLKQNLSKEYVIKEKNNDYDEKVFNDSTLLQSLIDGDEEAVSHIVINAHLEGIPLWKIIDRLICPAMIEVGEIWYRGEISVPQEDLETRTAVSTLHTLRMFFKIQQIK